MRNRTLVVIGTRPEAIKLAPLVRALGRRGLPVATCITGQHRDMVRPILRFFRIRVDHDLDVGQVGQSPAEVTCRVVRGVSSLLAADPCAHVVVQGDTSSALGGGLAAFYERVSLVHVEAGLRSGDLALPFPEEAHRRLLDVVADYLFVPTLQSRQNLLAEGTSPERIHLVGNTGIDALFLAREQLRQSPPKLPLDGEPGRPLLLLTMHRRESFGEPMQQALQGVLELSRLRPEIRVLFPVHPNPLVRQVAHAILGDRSNVCLCDPLDYPEFVQAMLQADLILTDSGGVQEEAATLGKRLLVLRETTERPEGIDAGLADLVGTDPDLLLARALAWLDSPPANAAQTINLYGDGSSSERICDVLLDSARTSIRLAA